MDYMYRHYGCNLVLLSVCVSVQGSKYSDICHMTVSETDASAGMIFIKKTLTKNSKTGSKNLREGNAESQELSKHGQTKKPKTE